MRGDECQIEGLAGAPDCQIGTGCALGLAVTISGSCAKDGDILTGGLEDDIALLQTRVHRGGTDQDKWTQAPGRDALP